MRLKVLIVTDLPEIGGSTTISEALALHLSLVGFESRLLTRTHAGHNVSRGALKSLEASNISVYWLRGESGYKLAEIAKVIWAIFGEWKPDFIIGNGIGWIGVATMIAGAGKPSVYYYINHNIYSRAFLRLRYFSLFYGCIAAITPMSLEPLKSIVSAGTVNVWLPQLTRLTASSPRRCEPPDRTKFCFGYLGVLSEAKGVRLLLDIWKKGAVCGDLHIAGRGDLVEDVKTAEIQLKQRRHKVSYEGSFEANDRIEFLAEFFGKIDVLVVPNIEDGEGLQTVILEALAHDCPVVVSRLGGNRCFELPWLAPKHDYVIIMASVRELVPTLNALPEKLGLRSVGTGAAYFNDWFSDRAVWRRWESILHPKAAVL